MFVRSYNNLVRLTLPCCQVPHFLSNLFSLARQPCTAPGTSAVAASMQIILGLSTDCMAWACPSSVARLPCHRQMNGFATIEPITAQVSCMVCVGRVPNVWLRAVPYLDLSGLDFRGHMEDTSTRVRLRCSCLRTKTIACLAYKQTRPLYNMQGRRITV